MTTSRVIRGTRAKIFLYICAVLVLTGIIACFNNTLSQLEDVRKSNDLCHQQEENLSTQLQGISEYKQRLEKSLKTEKAEHQQTKNDLKKLTEESKKYEKDSTDAKVKLKSMQQSKNLLEIRLGDVNEECSKQQQKQLQEINDLQAKLKEVKEELKKVQSAKESLKSQYLKLQIDKDNLERKLNDNQVNKNENESNINHLTKERNQLRRELEALKTKCPSYDTLPEPGQVTDFSSQKSSYKLSDITPSSSYLSSANKLPDANVINIPQPEKQEKSVLAVPNSANLQSFSKSSTKSGLKPSQASLNGARPLLVPTLTPKSVNKLNGGVSEFNKEKLPEGVVAIPKTKDENSQNEPELVDNRYRIAKESVNERTNNKVVKEDLDKENGAHEVFDAPLGRNNFEELAFADNDHLKHADKRKSDKNHIDNLGADKMNYDQDQPVEDKELQNEAQLEEEDDDDYPDNLGRQGAAIRN